MIKKITTILLLSSFSFLSVFWYSAVELKAANFLASKGVIKNNSTSPNDYRLDDTITRKEVMKIVWKLAWVNPAEGCEKKFKDVQNDWGCKYIERALSVGFISKSEKFRPDDNITKSEAVKMILKARGIEKKYKTWNWQEDYAKTVSDAWLVPTYNDYTADATRWWIFSLAANDYKEFKTFQEKIISSEVK